MLFALPLEAEESTRTPEALRTELKEVEAFRSKDQYEEGMRLAEKVLAIARDEQYDEVVIEALYQIAILQYFQEDYDSARANLEVGYNEAKRLKLTSLSADFLGALGVLEWKLGNLARAQADLVDTLALFEELKEPVCMASTANNLGNISASLKNYPEAIDWYVRGLSFLADTENDRLRASLLSNLAEVLIPSGRLQEAEQYLDQSMALEEKLGDPRNMAYTYYNFGELRSRQNKPEEALELYRKALRMQEELDDDWAASGTRLRLAEEYLNLDRTEDALSELEIAFEAAKKMNALSQLRDIAALMARAYGKTGESGLETYYKDLAGWFASRTRENQIKEPILPEPEREPEVTTPTELGAGNRHLPFRTATIIILCMMIGLLVMENVRLRKQAGKM